MLWKIITTELSSGFGHAKKHFVENMSSGSRDAASIVKDFEPGLRQSYHEHLAKFFFKQPLTSQVIEELPWQLMLASDLQALLDFLTDCG